MVSNITLLSDFIYEYKYVAKPSNNNIESYLYDFFDYYKDILNDDNMMPIINNIILKQHHILICMRYKVPVKLLCESKLRKCLSHKSSHIVMNHYVDAEIDYIMRCDKIYTIFQNNVLAGNKAMVKLIISRLNWAHYIKNDSTDFNYSLNFVLNERIITDQSMLKCITLYFDYIKYGGYRSSLRGAWIQSCILISPNDSPNAIRSKSGQLRH